MNAWQKLYWESFEFIFVENIVSENIEKRPAQISQGQNVPSDNTPSNVPGNIDLFRHTLNQESPHFLNFFSRYLQIF